MSDTHFTILPFDCVALWSSSSLSSACVVWGRVSPYNVYDDVVWRNARTFENRVCTVGKSTGVRFVRLRLRVGAMFNATHIEPQSIPDSGYGTFFSGTFIHIHTNTHIRHVRAEHEPKHNRQRNHCSQTCACTNTNWKHSGTWYTTIPPLLFVYGLYGFLFKNRWPIWTVARTQTQLVIVLFKIACVIKYAYNF